MLAKTKLKTDREYQLTFVTATDERPTLLEKYGQHVYDHVIHFAYKSKGIVRLLLRLLCSYLLFI